MILYRDDLTFNFELKKFRSRNSTNIRMFLLCVNMEIILTGL